MLQVLGELIWVFLLLIAGAIVGNWVLTLSPADIQSLIDKSLSVTTILLAQPGVFLTVNIIGNQKLTWMRRAQLALPAFFVLAYALPLAITGWLQPYLKF